MGKAQNTTFDLETWSCEIISFTKIPNTSEFEGICKRASLVRFSLIPLVVLCCLFAGTSWWVAFCERQRVRQADEFEKKVHDTSC